MRNKIINIVIVFLVVFVIFTTLQYMGLSISDKYETQLEGLKSSVEELKEANVLKAKIEYQKKIIPFLIFVSVITIPFLFLKKKK